MEYDPKGMPFRRLGRSGLRVPVFSLGGCMRLPLAFLEVLWSLTLHIDQGLRLVERSRVTLSRYTSNRGVSWDEYLIRLRRKSSRLHLRMVSTSLILLRVTRVESARKRCMFHQILY